MWGCKEVWESVWVSVGKCVGMWGGVRSRGCGGR